MVATLAGAAAGASPGSCSSGSTSENSPAPASAGSTGMDPFTAAGVKACATACSRPRPPRPRPPRRRRPRLACPNPPEAGGRAVRWSSGAESSGAESSAFERARGGRDSGCTGGGAGLSDSMCSASCSWPEDCSASKYAGCNGGGAGWSEGSAGGFLRRCKRSRIHLRMHWLFNTEESAGAIGDGFANHTRQRSDHSGLAPTIRTWLPEVISAVVRVGFHWSAAQFP